MAHNGKLSCYHIIIGTPDIGWGVHDSDVVVKVHVFQEEPSVPSSCRPNLNFEVVAEVL